MNATQQAIPPAVYTQPWPVGVIGRYLTIVGATVDVKRAADGEGATSKCTGCGEYEFPNTPSYIREQAQAHAERCRALPVPVVTA